MIIHFPRLYRSERRQEPCQVSVPFAKGVFREGMRLKITENGRELPVQSRILSRYADGSVKFLFARFEATLPGNRGRDLTAEIAEDQAEEIRGIRVTREEDGIRVDGGENGLRVTVREMSGHLAESLRAGKKTYAAEQLIGPRLKDGQGRVYLPVYRTWRVEEEGPLVTVLRGEGVLREEGAPGETPADEYPRFETFMTIYAGKPWMEISFRLINSTDEPLHAAGFVFAVMASKDAKYDDALRKTGKREHGDSVGEGSTAAGKVLAEDGAYQTTGLKLLGELEERLAGSPVRCCAGSSNYKTNFTVSGGAAVEKTVDTASLMAEANEHYPEVFYGTFFADRTEKGGGVCATVFQAQQNYPKAVKSDESGIYVMLVPEGMEKVVFESGMSRTQRFLLHFHGAEEPLAEIDNRSLIYQMPDRPWLDPEVYRDAGIAPDIFVRPDRMDPEVEIALILRCDAHSRSFGMLNFGDAPDMNYTLQGRGKGMLVWTNNEYDFPHACALQYMRTGERRFLDYAIAAGNHWMDVDVCHYSRDPLRIGGQWEHCRRHVLDSTMVCSHEWVEGLLDLYHLTGDVRALETALGIGENIRRLLETPAYQTRGESNARETGWALRSLTALYVETHDSGWLEKAEWIVDNFRAWKEEYGGWIAPYTDNTQIHTPFMIAVAMGSLYRYYEVFPSESLRQMLLDAAEDLLENAMTPYGLFIYKELPSLNRLGNNTLLLEAMTIAWRLSGEIRYLEKGLMSFRRDLRNPGKPVGKKTVMEGTVILENDSPKSFAQSFIPLAVYYKAATDAGLLNGEKTGPEEA
ncbi:MAG: glycoside hydrolase family 127 protein [Clostridiales bacterium]|nr:glycoside hydrolase family 127 protein [Clostridiales bacterium]